MNVLVSGGASSGKSEYAEKIAVDLNGGLKNSGLFYVATMDKNSGGDTKERILRHRKLRKGKGFKTVEMMFSGEKIDLFLSDDDIPYEDGNFCSENATVLLEDMGNLVARVVFSGRNCDYFRVISDFLLDLERKSRNLVIVTNEIFLDEIDLSDVHMRNYCEILAKANAFFAGISQKIVQIVAGIPLELSCESKQ